MTATMTAPADLSALPVAVLPDDFQGHMGPALAEAYAQYGPVFRASVPWAGGREFVFLVGPEANRVALLTRREAFSHYIGWAKIFGVETLFGNGLLTMEGPEHDDHRRMMNPAFAVAYMDRYLPIMNRVIGERVAEWVKAGRVEITNETRRITFDVAAETLAGLTPGDEVAQYRDVYFRMLNFEPVDEADFERRAAAMHDEVNALLLPKIAERRAHPTDDMLGMMVQARDSHGQPLSDAQIIAHTNILLVAGHETSTSLSAWLLYALATHPDYLARVRAEWNELVPTGELPSLDALKRMKVLDNALSEAERLYPPVPNGPRGVTEDVEIGGYTIPAGAPLFYSIAATHLLPGVWENPTAFDPDRFAPPREEHKRTPYALVGFGGGPRICIGINFAKIEIKAMIAQVLRDYDLSVVPGQDIRQRYDVTGGPVNGIVLDVRPRA